MVPCLTFSKSYNKTNILSHYCLPHKILNKHPPVYYLCWNSRIVHFGFFNFEVDFLDFKMKMNSALWTWCRTVWISFVLLSFCESWWWKYYHNMVYLLNPDWSLNKHHHFSLTSLHHGRLFNVRKHLYYKQAFWLSGNPLHFNMGRQWCIILTERHSSLTWHAL